jgi:hypothetical protein
MCALDGLTAGRQPRCHPQERQWAKIPLNSRSWAGRLHEIPVFRLAVPRPHQGPGGTRGERAPGAKRRTGRGDAVLGTARRSHTQLDIHNSTPKSKRQTTVLSRRTYWACLSDALLVHRAHRECDVLPAIPSQFPRRRLADKQTTCRAGCDDPPCL